MYPRGSSQGRTGRGRSGPEGVRKYFLELKCAIPFKKRGPRREHRSEKAKEVTPEQESFNKKLSKPRVVVEHTISRVKKFNIFGTEFRNRLRNYDVMTDMVSGLVNFRIMGEQGLLLS